jgi:hypothetical protein
MMTDRNLNETDQRAVPDGNKEGAVPTAKGKPARRKGPAIASKLVCSGVAATITFGVAGFLGYSNQAAAANETDSAASDIENGAALGTRQRGTEFDPDIAPNPVLVVVHRRIHVVKASIPEPEGAPAIASDVASVAQGKSRAAKRTRFNPNPATRPTANNVGLRTKRVAPKLRLAAPIAAQRAAARAKPSAAAKPRAVARNTRRAKTKAS